MLGKTSHSLGILTGEVPDGNCHAFSEHQFTLPVDMVRRLGLRTGDKLAVELIDEHLYLLPEPESWREAFSGERPGYVRSYEGLVGCVRG